MCRPPGHTFLNLLAKGIPFANSVHLVWAKVSFLAILVDFSLDKGTLEYRINGGGGENNRGGWKWFDITIIRGLE